MNTYDKINHWYGWSNEEDLPDLCPVHPKTQVDVIVDGEISGPCSAEDWNWSGAIIAFRITRLHREPREWWLALRGDGVIYILPTEVAAEGFNCPETVHVREVLPGDEA